VIQQGRLGIKIDQQLFHDMKNKQWLMAYLTAHEELKQMHGENKLFMKIVNQYSLFLLNTLSEYYMHQDNETKAYFAFVVFCVMPNNYQKNFNSRTSENLTQTFVSYLSSKSIYVRSNAFRVLIKSGDIHAIYYALVMLDDTMQIRNNKIFSDFMLAFHGEMEAFLALLAEHLTGFKMPMQVMIINYLRLLPSNIQQSNCYQILIKMMRLPNEYGETVIATIRYFGKHSCADAYTILADFLDRRSDTNKGYNYAAIAARSLRAYPCKKTEEILIKHLCDNDWFVRLNSADSLIEMGANYKKIVFKIKNEDAKEMLIQRIEVNKLLKHNIITKGQVI
jgi:hypothetical protein